MLQCATPSRDPEETLFGFPLTAFGLASRDNVSEIYAEPCEVDLDELVPVARRKTFM